MSSVIFMGKEDLKDIYTLVVAVQYLMVSCIVHSQ